MKADAEGFVEDQKSGGDPRVSWQLICDDMWKNIHQDLEDSLIDLFLSRKHWQAHSFFLG